MENERLQQASDASLAKENETTNGSLTVFQIISRCQWVGKGNGRGYHVGLHERYTRQTIKASFLLLLLLLLIYYYCAYYFLFKSSEYTLTYFFWTIFQPMVLSFHCRNWPTANQIVAFLAFPQPYSPKKQPLNFTNNHYFFWFYRTSFSCFITIYIFGFISLSFRILYDYWSHVLV